MPDPALSRPVLPSGTRCMSRRAHAMPSCFDTSPDQRLWYHHDLPRQREHHRAHTTAATLHTTMYCHHHQYHHHFHLHLGLLTPQPYRAAPHGPRPSLELVRAQTGRRTKAVRDPPRAIDTASSAITQRPRAIDLKLGPPAAGQRRRPRPHQTLPDFTSAGQGFDRSAIVPVYYACTTSFTSPPTAALPSVRDGADPWRAARLHFGRRDAIWLVHMLDLCLLAAAAAAAPAAAAGQNRRLHDPAASLVSLSLTRSRPTTCQHALHPEGHYGYAHA